LGQILNLTVVAEGVEEETQVSILQEYSCDEAQGYYFSTPRPPDEITERLKVGSIAIASAPCAVVSGAWHMLGSRAVR
jgi:EAL domain-containing protein (putative c-di-GMP-specific phosphodiesterase class I)